MQIVKYVAYVRFPSLCAYAVRLLHWFVMSSDAHPKLYAVLSSNPEDSTIVMSGLVKCLHSVNAELEDDEADVVYGDDTALGERDHFDDFDPDSLLGAGDAAIRCPPDSAIVAATCRAVVRMLLLGLRQPMPNVAQRLLGFPHPAHLAAIADPSAGRGGTVTCFHAVLELLQRQLDSRPFARYPYLTELLYALVFRLCEHPDTSAPTMRYLRTSADFFYTHYAALMRYLADGDAKPRPASPRLPRQRQRQAVRARQIALRNAHAWLMMAVALEIHTTSRAGQIGATQRLLGLLFTAAGGQESTSSAVEDLPAAVATVSGSGAASAEPDRARRPQMRMAILELLDALELAAVPDTPPPQTMYRADLVDRCREQSSHGALIYNVPALHALLTAEHAAVLSGTSVSSASQAGSMQSSSMLMQRAEDDALALLAWAAERNGAEEWHAANRNLLEGWRRTVLVAVGHCLELLAEHSETRDAVLYELSLALVPKLASEATAIPLASMLAEVLVLLMSQLRQTVVTQVRLYAGLAHGSGAVAPAAGLLRADRLTRIMQSVLTTLLRPAATRALRGCLYSVLIDQVQLIQQTSPSAPWNVSMSYLYAPDVGPLAHELSEAENEMVLQHRALERGCLLAIESLDASFMDLLARDACEGSDIVQHLTLTVLGLLVAVDRRQRWLPFLRHHGYLCLLLEDLAESDARLQTLLVPSVDAPDDLGPLFTFESKMMLLLQIAHTGDGARSLVQDGLMQRLYDFHCIDLRPEADTASVNDRYASLCLRARVAPQPCGSRWLGHSTHVRSCSCRCGHGR